MHTLIRNILDRRLVSLVGEDGLLQLQQQQQQ